MFELAFPENLAVTLRPTPVQYLKNTSDRNQPYHLWIKRDDLTGMELSGNKVRKLDFLLKEALDQECSYVFTCGGLQSNHCRATAFMAARLGLKCRLFLRGARPAEPTGNYLLDLLSGAEIEFVTSEEYRQIDGLMSAAAKGSGGVYIVPEGGSNATGAWGYISCFAEIMRQIRDQDLSIDTIAVATGSGGTHAGLLIGKILMASDIEVVSVNVCDDAGYFRHKILQIIDEFRRKYAISIEVDAGEIRIIDGFVGAGYGLIGADEADLIKRFGREEGIILDPVYGVKAFKGLEASLSDRKLTGENILFIHTGGIFGIFPVGGHYK